MFGVNIVYMLTLPVLFVCDVAIDLALAGSTVVSTSVSLTCPAACHCTMSQSPFSQIAADCEGPIRDDDRFEPETEVVHVTGNCHRTFATVMASLGALEALRELSIRRCHLHTVDELTRAGDALNWGSLLDLDVGFNLITHVADRTFVGMSSLRNLVLRHNRIEMIERDAFYGLDHLSRLDLTENRLSMVTAVDMRWLCALRSIDELSLRDNGVHVLAADGFRCRPTGCPLRHLDLGENRIVRVEESAFDGLFNITQLDLDFSQLTTVPSAALVRLSATLEELDMNGNRLASLLSSSFRDLRALRVLRLNRMSTLKFADRKCFTNMTSLERVELADNAALTYIDRGAFVDTPSVSNISLSGCRLSAVDQHFVVPLTSLKLLDLRRNPLICDCHTMWMQSSNVSLVDRGIWHQCRDDSDGGPDCRPRIAELFNTELDVPLTNSFSLYCRAVGFPPPRITWKLPSSRHHTSTPSQVHAIPHILLTNVFL